MEPAENFEVNRQEFLGALQRVNIFSNQYGKINVQTQENLLRLFVSNGDNEAEEVIDTVNPSTIEINLNLNAKLLLNCITTIDDETIIIAKGDQSVANSLFVRPKNTNKELWLIAPLAK